MRSPITNPKGYTLIELLLYISILGSLLMGVSMYFITSATARVKNQTIAEVDRQGALAMDYITRVIRSADAITAPSSGSSNSLTLDMPSPAVDQVFSLSGAGGTATLGYNQDGTSTDSSNSNNINATSFIAPASGTITTLNARVAIVGTTPNNRGEMAIYSGNTNPTTLLASSATKVLTANSWNAFTISSVNVTAGQKYWLAYNANGLGAAENNLRYHSGSAGQSLYMPQSFGTWPSSWTGTSQNFEFSMYATITTTGGGAALQVQEGVSPAVALTNNKVEVTSLNFTNFSRSGTPGVVRVSFTISRLNPNNRNEYHYQKTFTSSAALR